MPGMGTSTQTTQQQSQTQPWQPAVPFLSGILSQLQGQLPNTGTTTNQNQALYQIENNASNANNFAPSIYGSTANLLAGGGALNQAPAIQNAFKAYQAQTNPIASNTNYDPMQTPGLGDQLQALRDNITQGVNGSFVAAGRDGSAYNQKALGQGLAAGLAPVLTNQYNANVANQQGAAGNLYQAANGSAALLSGLQQQFLANQQAGVGQVGTGLDASNVGNNAILQAEAQRLGIPVQNLGLLANIGIPIAGLGNQSSGTSNTESTASPLAQALGIVSGIGGIKKII